MYIQFTFTSTIKLEKQTIRCRGIFIEYGTKILSKFQQTWTAIKKVDTICVKKVDTFCVVYSKIQFILNHTTFLTLL